MNKLRLVLIILFTVMLSTSCSLVDKLKEKFSSKKNEQKKEETTNGKEKTVENTSSDDLAFYNKYIDVSNKISEAGDGLNKAYYEVIPEPKSVKKGMFLVTIVFDLKVGDLDRAIKEQKRSYFDGGELSKLKANDEMKNDIEGTFKSTLDAMEGYYNAAKKVSDYYKDKMYESDPSKAPDLDSDIKSAYGKFKDAYEKFNGAVKKHKPAKKQRDVSSMTDPKEKSLAVLMNAYENTLDNAEVFFTKFQKIEKSSDMSSYRKDIEDFDAAFQNEKKTVASTEFTEVTKGFKYSFEDYFAKTETDFVSHTNRFLDNASKGNIKDTEFNKGYDDVVQYYNYMITAYNTSIQSLNMMSQFNF